MAKQIAPISRHLHCFFNLTTNIQLLKYRDTFLLGLKHMLQPLDTTNEQIRSSFERFKHSTLWKTFFENQPKPNNETPYNPRLNRVDDQIIPCHLVQVSHPIHKTLQKMENCLEKFIEINPRKFRVCPTKIILEEIQSKYPTTIFKPADKNLGLVALETSHYDTLVMEHLGDQDNYERLTFTTTTHQDFIDYNTDSYTELISTIALDKQETRFVNSWSDFKIPKFHVLPKIHKTGNLHGRPISGAVRWVSTPISKVLDTRLQFYLPKFLYILTDSHTLVNILESMNSNQTQTILGSTQLLTADVVSLYPNIDLQLLRIIISDLNTDLIPLFDFICKTSVTSYNGNIFIQKTGITMGTNAAVSLANIYLGTLLDPYFKNNPNVTLYRRYIDDLFIIWNGSTLDLNEFKTTLNSIHPKLTLTWSPTHLQTVDFLDLTIFVENDTYNTKIFQKTLNKYNYVTLSSHHPRHTIKGFIYGELTRYSRLSTKIIDYLKTKQLFYSRLLDRGYTHAILKPIFLRHTYRKQSTPPLNSGQKLLPLVIPFSLRDKNNQLQQIAHDFKDAFKVAIPKSNMIIAFSGSQTIQNFLTSSSLTLSQSHSITLTR